MEKEARIIMKRILEKVPESSYDYYFLSKEEFEEIKNTEVPENFDYSDIPALTIFSSAKMIVKDVVGIYAGPKFEVTITCKSGKDFPLGFSNLFLTTRRELLVFRDADTPYYDGKNVFAVTEHNQTRITPNLSLPFELYPYDIGNGIDYCYKQAHLLEKDIKYPVYVGASSSFDDTFVKFEEYGPSDTLIYGDVKKEIPHVPVVKKGEILSIPEILFRYKWLEREFKIPFRDLGGFYKTYF